LLFYGLSVGCDDGGEEERGVEGGDDVVEDERHSDDGHGDADEKGSFSSKYSSSISRL